MMLMVTSWLDPWRARYQSCPCYHVAADNNVVEIVGTAFEGEPL